MNKKIYIDDMDFDINQFIDEHWQKIKKESEKLEKMFKEMYGEEEEGIYIIYDIED